MDIGPTSHEAVGLTDTASRHAASMAGQMDVVHTNAFDRRGEADQMLPAYRGAL